MVNASQYNPMRRTSVWVWVQPCWMTRTTVPTIETARARSISGEIIANTIWNSQACGMPTKANPLGRRSDRIERCFQRH